MYILTCRSVNVHRRLMMQSRVLKTLSNLTVNTHVSISTSLSNKHEYTCQFHARSLIITLVTYLEVYSLQALLHSRIRHVSK